MTVIMVATAALLAAAVAGAAVPARADKPEAAVSKGEVVLIRNGKAPLCLTGDAETGKVTVVACVSPPCDAKACIGPYRPIPLDQQWLVSSGRDHDWTYILSEAAPGMSLSIGPVYQRIIRTALRAEPTPLRLGGHGGTQYMIELGTSGAYLSRFYTGSTYAVWANAGKTGYWQNWELPAAPAPVQG